MNPFFRYSLFAFESLVYGPTYGFMHQLIRLPEPLNPEILWDEIMKPRSSMIEWATKNYPPEFARKILSRRTMRRSHIEGIADHYDISNDFYELMLDKKYMFYSCADHHSENDTLEQAQTNKANFLLNLIQPKAGQKILELGCGWGPMLKAIYEVTGDKENLYGYTLSKEQLEFNNERNGFQVEINDFITKEYNENEFDCIYSIGAWEHVRPNELSTVLAKLYKAIKPGGRLVKHFFCLNVEGVPVSMLVGQLCFPGSQLASYRTHFQKFEEAGFKIEQQTIHDYRPTVRAWYDNLVANQEEAIRVGGIRNYNRHLVFLAATYRFFAEGESSLLRFLLRKPE